MKKIGSQETILYQTQTQQVAARALPRSWHTPEEEEAEVEEEVEELEAKDEPSKTVRRAVHKQQPNPVGEYYYL
jgi:hypothetical protein